MPLLTSSNGLSAISQHVVVVRHKKNDLQSSDQCRKNKVIVHEPRRKCAVKGRRNCGTIGIMYSSGSTTDRKSPKRNACMVQLSAVKSETVVSATTNRARRYWCAFVSGCDT